RGKPGSITDANGVTSSLAYTGVDGWLGKGDRFIFTTIISATAHAKPLKANNSLNQSPLPRASRSLFTVSALEPLCSEN
ncbi:hypothetical protein JTL52_32590, partial [Pseudomonas aeruginosa]|nr:hypothetical protein [Pseudomonas aeruginosa]